MKHNKLHTLKKVVGLGFLTALGLLATSLVTRQTKLVEAPPNILFILADDWSFPHAGIYGDSVVKTPNFDRIAREGVLFTHAFCAAPSCTPSRAAVLTGQYSHRLEQGGNLWGSLPKKFPTYTDLLEKQGYRVGFEQKGWSPGKYEAGGYTRNPAGNEYKNFAEFVQKLPADQPFCFWFGSRDPHRPYVLNSGVKAGLNPAKVTVPAWLPDHPAVRADLLDYYHEIERLDRDLGSLLDRLEKMGRLANTLIVMTGDNGMPFPRAKANLYDAGTRVPLAVYWKNKIKGGQRRDELVNLIDLAPTFLQAAGQPVPTTMNGKSLLPLLTANEPDGSRETAFLERERHANVRRGDLSYPARAIRTKTFLYIRNLRPDRWPAGDPKAYVAVGPYGDVDDSPSKQLLLSGSKNVARFSTLAFAKRPAEELFDLEKDPAQLKNVATDPAYRPDLERLRNQLTAWQKETGDPRATNDDDRWDTYPYYGPPIGPDTYLILK